MSPAIKIECLREPDLLFGRRMTGVEPRRIMARAGAVDHGNGEQLSVGLVGPAEDIAIASAWLPRLNKLGIAREKSARRCPRLAMRSESPRCNLRCGRTVRAPHTIPTGWRWPSAESPPRTNSTSFSSYLKRGFRACLAMCDRIAFSSACQIKLRTCGSAIRACPYPSVTPLNVCSARKNRNRWCCSSRCRRS